LLETATFFNTDTFFNADTILYEHLNAYALTKKHFADWGKQFALMKKIQFVNIKLLLCFNGSRTTSFDQNVTPLPEMRYNKQEEG
jgi:hypothetical protein